MAAAAPPAGSEPAMHERRRRLAQAGAQLGLPLSDIEIDRLLAYLALLQRWSRTYNLTALRDPEAMLSHHLVDCLALVAPLRRHAAGRKLRVLDVGSGAGLPGVVLAIMQPDWTVHCVDAVAKKTAFVQQVIVELGLTQVSAVHARVQDLSVAPPFDVITSRAFAALAEFVSLTAPLLAPGGVWVAMKGQPARDELEALPANTEVFHVEPLSVPLLDARRCLVWVRPRAD